MMKQKLTVRRVFGEERPEHTVLCRSADCRIVDGVYEGTDAQNVAQEDELLPSVGTHLADAREELECSHPLVRCDTAQGS